VYLPLALLVTPFLFVPAILGLVATLTNYGPIQRDVIWVGLHNFGAILADRTFGAAVRNAVFLTIAAVALELSIGFGLAYAMRWPFRGRGTVRVLLLAPWLISPVAAGVMWRFLLGSETGFVSFGARLVGLPSVAAPTSQHGLALLTVVLVETWRVAPLVAFLVQAALATIPPERWADAAIDGLSTRATIRHVALPATRGLILALTVLLVGGALATFDSILTLTGGGPGTETTTPALYAYDKAFQFGAWPIGTAAGWLIGGAVLVVGLVYLRITRRDG
jgi:ABC-type sugar transport system permease subunit